MIDKFIKNPHLLQDYYKSIKNKYKCDISLYKLEIDLLNKLYTEYFKIYTPDYLLNTKIDLYKDKILPKHLKIIETCNILDFEIIKPYDFISTYLLFIEYCTSISKDHDALLSMIIYSLIKSGVRNMKKKISFINIYRRRIFISCEHKIKRSEEEISYYMRILEIAVVFIERMEYKDLNISREEFDRLIL